jgi:hypothetical protein
MITRRLTLVTLKKKKISSPTSYTYWWRYYNIHRHISVTSPRTEY